MAPLTPFGPHLFLLGVLSTQIFRVSISLKAILTFVFLTAALAANAQETVLLSFNGTVLHSFNNDQTDGLHPTTGLTLDAAGNLYGVTAGGGTNGGGTVYQMTPQSGGKWIEKVIHNFIATGTTGINPIGRLTFDAGGNLFGSASWGGIHGEGTVFEMKRKGGTWIERDLYSFNNNGVD